MQVNWLNCLSFLRRDCFLAYALVRVILDYCQRQMRAQVRNPNKVSTEQPLRDIGYATFAQATVLRIADHAMEPWLCFIVVIGWAGLYLFVFFFGIALTALSGGQNAEGICNKGNCEVQYSTCKSSID